MDLFSRRHPPTAAVLQQKAKQLSRKEIDKMYTKQPSLFIAVEVNLY